MLLNATVLNINDNFQTLIINNIISFLTAHIYNYVHCMNECIDVLTLTDTCTVLRN